jgi:4-carboxymuconolactone decarboxylase
VPDEIDPRLARGLATAVRLFRPGAPGAPKFAYPEEIAADWNRFSVSTVMGDVWGREGLALVDRARITIAVLAATGKLEQLKAYVVGGINLGLSRAEICEIVLHISVYAGFPTSIQALGAVKEVFDELDASAG